MSPPFFRDRLTWDYLATEIIPKLLSTTDRTNPSLSGCASGQEAYTLAIVLAEALGLEVTCSRVKIYATDVDEEAPPEMPRHLRCQGGSGYSARVAGEVLRPL